MRKFAMKKFISKTVVKNYLQTGGYLTRGRVAPETTKRINRAVAEMLQKATKRAKENGRKTVRPHDVAILD